MNDDTELKLIEMSKVTDYSVEIKHLRITNNFSCSMVDLNGYGGNVWGVGNTIDESVQECYKHFLNSTLYNPEPAKISYVTVTLEVKERLMRDCGLKESDFEIIEVEGD